MAVRLRLARIEAKPKRVRFIPGHTRTVRLTEEQEKALLDVRDRIEKGHELPRHYYRVNRDSSPDELLGREGILHLHLSATDRDATLFLVQYDDHVVFLGVNNHSAFRYYPPGSSLARLHANALVRIEREIDVEAEQVTASKREAVARGLRRSRGTPGSI